MPIKFHHSKKQNQDRFTNLISVFLRYKLMEIYEYNSQQDTEK